MKKGGGNKKGSAFEREVCKMLSLWWTDDERDDVFWRTAGSGGRATNRFKRGSTTAFAAGDITFTDPIGSPLLMYCCFELKRGYGQWCVLDALDRLERSKPSKFENFWQQAKESAIQAYESVGKKGRIPYSVVIFKRDQKKTSIMIDGRMLSELAPLLGPHRSNKIHITFQKNGVVLMDFEEFLNYVSPESITKTLKEWK